MSLRSLPADFSSPVVAAIDARLAGVTNEQHVRIALAVKNGSRARGFP